MPRYAEWPLKVFGKPVGTAWEGWSAMQCQANEANSTASRKDQRGEQKRKAMEASHRELLISKFQEVPDTLEHLLAVALIVIFSGEGSGEETHHSGKAKPEEGPDYVKPIILSAVILMAALLQWYSELKAGSQMEAMQKLQAQDQQSCQSHEPAAPVQDEASQKEEERKGRPL
eukprot:s61_g29.t1